MIGQAISKNSFILTVFALCTAGLLAVTFQGTKKSIAASERSAAQKALLEVIAPDRHDNDMLVDLVAIPQDNLKQLGLRSQENVHIAKKNNEVVAVIVPSVAPDGYSGAIRMIVGVWENGDIAGVRILTHNETPGLGDKVDLKKSDWVLSFNGKSLTAPSLWAVKKDGGEFDQFTGATITPRAVVKQVEKALQFVQANHSALFDPTPTTEQANSQ